ncbi:MAG: 50S ribosomal protein L9 [Alphaproteobacteria bacterium]|nr:50S ribosomal protein L9 [Alphaproteobacteria bacterium]
MQVILLERIDNLGGMGDVVKVKPGFARNFLLPQKKALRATKDNIAYFETQKAGLEKANAERRKEAEKQAAKMKDLKVNVIRHAAEGGQLYGSVSSRDIADAINESSSEKVERHMVSLNQAFKTIGLFPVTVALHPEVKLVVTVNIARTEEEAKIQAKTGRALTVDASGRPTGQTAEETAKEAFLDDSALANEQLEAESDAEDAAADAEKAAKRAAKKKPKAEAAAESETEEEGEAA